MEIINYIPFGKSNAVSRTSLVLQTGESDRMVRERISRAREEYVILSLENGKGYYRPNAEDYPDLKKHLRREESRGKSLFKTLKVERALCEDYERGRLNGT